MTERKSDVRGTFKAVLFPWERFIILKSNMTTDQKGYSCLIYAKGSAWMTVYNIGKVTPGIVTVHSLRGWTRNVCTNESFLL